MDDTSHFVDWAIHYQKVFNLWKIIIDYGKKNFTAHQQAAARTLWSSFEHLTKTFRDDKMFSCDRSVDLRLVGPPDEQQSHFWSTTTFPYSHFFRFTTDDQ